MLASRASSLGFRLWVGLTFLFFGILGSRDDLGHELQALSRSQAAAAAVAEKPKEGAVEGKRGSHSKGDSKGAKLQEVHPLKQILMEAKKKQPAMPVLSLTDTVFENVAEQLVRAMSTIFVSMLKDVPQDAFIVNETIKALWQVAVLMESHHMTQELEEAAEYFREHFVAQRANTTKFVTEFRKVGETFHLVEGANQLLTIALASVPAVFPSLTTLYGALYQLVQQLGHTWDLTSMAQPGLATEVLWHGLEDFLEVQPHYLASDTCGIMSRFDPLLHEQTGTVFDAKRSVLQAKVCYKANAPTETQLPSLCPSGYEYEGTHYCLPAPDDKVDCFVPCGNKEGMCMQYCGDGKACCKQQSDQQNAACQGFQTPAAGETKGHAGHYCVEPGENVKIKVTGAGEPKVNGYYNLNGTAEGKESFVHTENTELTIHWTGEGMWQISGQDEQDQDVVYYSTQLDTVAPPSSAAWTAETGTDPLPNLLYAKDGIVLPFGPPIHVNTGITMATCHPNSAHNMAFGARCLKPCAEGFVLRAGACEQQCANTGFPADGKGACGTSHDELLKILIQRRNLEVVGALDVAALEAVVKEAGVKLDGIQSTFTSLLDAGQPFTHSACKKHS